LNTEILTYSRSKGAFAGITLNGAVVQQDDDSTLAIYGRTASFHSILSGQVRAPKSTLTFMKAIADIAHASQVAEAN
jgi:lipid-binding SYLF domain-containing protein